MKYLKKHNEDLGFDVEPKDVPIKTWVLYDEDSDGQYAVTFFMSEHEAEKAMEEAKTDYTSRVYIAENTFKMTFSNGQWYLKGGIYSGGFEPGPIG